MGLILQALVCLIVRIKILVPGWNWTDSSKAENYTVELKLIYSTILSSFQITLDSIMLPLLNSKCASFSKRSRLFTPIGESEYGGFIDFSEECIHLGQKMVSFKHPEEIGGKGLLKYCILRSFSGSQRKFRHPIKGYFWAQFLLNFEDDHQDHGLANYMAYVYGTLLCLYIYGNSSCSCGFISKMSNGASAQFAEIYFKSIIPKISKWITSFNTNIHQTRHINLLTSSIGF